MAYNIIELNEKLITELRALQRNGHSTPRCIQKKN